jgi:hypothetical protein
MNREPPSGIELPRGHSARPGSPFNIHAIAVCAQNENLEIP